MLLPTLKIDDGQGGYVIINESDFDPSTHKRFEEPVAPGDAPGPAPEAARAGRPASRKGKKQ